MKIELPEEVMVLPNPRQRLEIYLAMQTILVNGRKPNSSDRVYGHMSLDHTFSAQNIPYGLCHVLKTIHIVKGWGHDIELEDLPEIWELEPDIYWEQGYYPPSGYWYNPKDTNIRLAILRLAIAKVKRLIDAN